MHGQVVLNIMAFFNTKVEMDSLPHRERSLSSVILLLDSLTYEFVSFVEPGKQLLAVVVVYRDTHKVALADKVWLGAGVASIQHIGDTILRHQIL